MEVNVKEFKSRRLATEHVRASLGIVRAPDQLTDWILSGCVDACEVSHPIGAPALGLNLGRWVIRDDDLELFRVVRETLVILASTQFLLAAEQSSIVSIAMGAIFLIRNFSRSIGHLSKDQLAVLIVMRSNQRPMSAEAIAEALAGSESLWTTERVSTALKGMNALVTKKDVVAITKQDAEGKWILVGV